MLGYCTIVARILYGSRCCNESDKTGFEYATRSEMCRTLLLFVLMAVVLRSVGAQSLGKCPQMNTMKSFDAKQASKYKYEALRGHMIQCFFGGRDQVVVGIGGDRERIKGA